MSRIDIRHEIGHVLCRACEAARSQGDRSATGLAQSALETARGEIGEMPQRDKCPMGGSGEAGCPLLRCPER